MRSAVSVSAAIAGPLAPLAIEDRHLLGVVALACDDVDRGRLLDACQVVLGEVDVDRAERLGEPLAGARADERDDVLAAGEDPGDRELGDGRVLLGGDCAQRLDEFQVALEVLAGEARSRGPEVMRREGRPVLSTSGPRAARARGRRRQ